MNSAYGVLANQWFAFFDPQLAESVTTAGQLVIKWSEKTANDYLNKVLKTNKDYIVAMDTDSISVFLPLYLSLSSVLL